MESAWNDVIQRVTSELAEFLEACGDSSTTDDDRGAVLDIPRTSCSSNNGLSIEL